MSAAPVYPLPRPADTDNRFSLGLALDIAAVLTRHGYPPITAGADLIRCIRPYSGSSISTTTPTTNHLTSHPR